MVNKRLPNGFIRLIWLDMGGRKFVSVVPKSMAKDIATRIVMKGGKVKVR